MTWKGGARSNNRSTTQLCQVMWRKLKRGPRQTSQRMRSASQRLLNVHRGIPVCCGVFPNHPMCSRSSRYFNNWMCCKYRWICWGLLRSAKHFTAGTWKTIFLSWGWFLGGSQRNTDLPKVQENHRKSLLSQMLGLSLTFFKLWVFALAPAYSYYITLRAESSQCETLRKFAQNWQTESHWAILSCPPTVWDLNSKSSRQHRNARGPVKAWRAAVTSWDMVRRTELGVGGL